MLTLTDLAKEKITNLLIEENDPNLNLRVFVQGGGCSGFSYGFTFDEDKADDDYELTMDGAKVLVDAMSMTYLSGANIDYKDDLTGSQFVITNPNATSTCGCGSSFSI